MFGGASVSLWSLKTCWVVVAVKGELIKAAALHASQTLIPILQAGISNSEHWTSGNVGKHLRLSASK